MDMNDLLEEREQQESERKRSFAFRLNIFFFTVFLLFSVLIVRLAFMQFVEGRELSEQIGQTYTRTLPVAPIRGNIYDRKGSAIAYSTSTQSLYYRLESNRSPEELVETAYKLAEIFEKYGDGKEPMTAEDILKNMDAGVDIHGNEVNIFGYAFEPRRVKSGLTNKEVAYLMEHGDLFPGFEVVEESIRNYDEDRVAVQLIGYLRPYSTAVGRVEESGGSSYLSFYTTPENREIYLDHESVGYDGLEFMYQEQLRGQNGSKSYPVDARGRIIGPVTMEYPVKGNDLYLTLDKDVQIATQQAIIEHLEFLQSDEARRHTYYSMGSEAISGYAVAMEVDTGNVVAMASIPDYDPKIWQGGRWISSKDYMENEYLLKNGTISEALANFRDYEERKRRPTSLVPLGSTVKPLTILVGLNEGLISPYAVYNTPATYYYGRDGRVRNATGVPAGRMDATRAIAVSSNTFMAELVGNALFMREFRNGDANRALEIWDSYMEAFGLGVSTGSGLPNEIRGVKDYMDIESMGSVQAALVQASFGQGGRYTALQLAQYTTMLANRGKRLKPQFVDRITTYDGKTVMKMEPEVLDEVDFPDEYWDIVQRGMEQVRMQGFEGFPHKVAAKTGTSEQDVAGKRLNNAVFIAYAPADKPKLAVVVIVPNGGFGAYGAAPIARKIFDAYDAKIGLVDE